MKCGEVVYIRNCYGLRYNILGIFEKFENNSFYFATPWRDCKDLNLANYTCAEFIPIPWSKKIYKTIFCLDFYDQKINKKIIRWLTRVNYPQLLTHSNQALRTFAKLRLEEEAIRKKFRNL